MAGTQERRSAASGEFPARKHAAQSDVSGIGSESRSETTSSTQGRERNGFVKLRRGRLERDAPDGETPWNYEHAMRALGPIAFCAFLYVLDRTVAAYKAKPAADIDENDLAEVLRVTPRHVRKVIDDAITAGAMSRDAEHYWRLSVHVEALESLPARPRVHKPRTKPQPNEAEVRAPQMALPLKSVPVVEEIHIPATTAAPIQVAPVVGEIDIPESEKDFRPRETYCPWNWPCPHLSSELPDGRPSDLVNIEEPTTTGAGRPASCEQRTAEAADLENAYLARFLQPATRIGELLKIDGMVIDDALAGVMWADCSAVNPDLTPREFVSIANAKLAEWRPRPLDKRPGLRIKSTITGTLKASMPNAVCGALYMVAREQAPAELARDCRDAREILVGDASPRDRAWARAMLIEAGELET